MRYPAAGRVSASGRGGTGRCRRRTGVGVLRAMPTLAGLEICFIPATALQAKAACRDLFHKAALIAGGTLRQRGITDLLQRFKLIATLTAPVFVNRHKRQFPPFSLLIANRPRAHGCRVSRKRRSIPYLPALWQPRNSACRRIICAFFKDFPVQPERLKHASSGRIKACDCQAKTI